MKRNHTTKYLTQKASQQNSYHKLELQARNRTTSNENRTSKDFSNGIQM